MYCYKCVFDGERGKVLGSKHWSVVKLNSDIFNKWICFGNFYLITKRLRRFLLEHNSMTFAKSALYPPPLFIPSVTPKELLVESVNGVGKMVRCIERAGYI